jgi:hypothetical protein
MELVVTKTKKKKKKKPLNEVGRDGELFFLNFKVFGKRNSPHFKLKHEVSTLSK